MQTVWGIEVPLDHMFMESWFKGWNIIIAKQSFDLQSSTLCEVTESHIFMALSTPVHLPLYILPCTII